MKISIVIPAFNEEKLIASTLDSIHTAIPAFTSRGWSTELIVCDNNSTDGTADLARAAGAVVVFEPVNQIARSRNRGAEAASGDWLIFVDADSHPSRELFSDVADAIVSGKYLFGGSTVDMKGAPLAGAIGAAIWNCISRVKKYAAGSFIFCETAAFRKIGGFDATLFVGEELDLSKRLKALARESGKKAVILHRHPLITSARKLSLYSRREHVRFMMRTLFNWRGTVTSRDACHPWYDGRR